MKLVNLYNETTLLLCYYYYEGVMFMIKEFTYSSNGTKVIDKTNNILNNSNNKISNSLIDLDSSSYDVESVTLSANIFGFSNENYGYKNPEKEEEITLKNQKSLSDISNFTNLKKLILENCDLYDLGLIPDSIEEIHLSCCEIRDYRGLKDKEKLTKIVLEGIENGIVLDNLKNENVTWLTINGVDRYLLGTLSVLPNLEYLKINYTSLDNLDCLKDNKKIKKLIIPNNLLTDVSILYGSEIETLDISNNSINEIDLSQFPNLNTIFVTGNYALYTQEFLNYCDEHNIHTDITQEDIDNIISIKKIIDSLDLDGKTDLEKESIIYEYVLNHMEYDDKTTEESNYNPITTALTGKGVCYAYAEFFKALCNAAGINVYTITGLGKQNFFIKGSHAWNLVEIDGQYYLCDPTWSDAIRNDISGYSIKHIISGLFGQELDSNEGDNYFNVYGKDTEEFIKHHYEWVEGHDDYNADYGNKEDRAYIIAKKDVQSNSVDTSTSEGQENAINTAIASVIPLESGVRKFSNEVAKKIINNSSNSEVN